jgi:hypothetical protein
MIKLIQREIILFFSTNRLSINMQHFLEHTYEIVSKSLERYLYQNEQNEAIKEVDEIYKKKHQIELTGQAKLRSILRNAKTNSKKLPIINGLSSNIFIRYQSMIFHLYRIKFHF